jgi:hypothetical protein
VSPFHYGYLDYANFSKQIRSFRAQSRHPIHVRDHASPLDTYVQGGAPCAIVKLTDIDKRRSDTPRFDGAIITLSDHMLQDLPRLLRLVAAQCMDDAPILICVDAIHAVIFQSRYAVYGDMIELMGSELPPAARVESFALVTAPARFVPAYLLFQAKEITGSRRLSAWLGAVIVALPAYLSLLKANLRRKPATSADPGVCTSATIWLRGPWESKTRAMAERALQFDTAYYNRINTDVAQARIDPETHFFEHGWREKRDPSAYFSVSGYLSANPDVAAAQINPLTHFRDYGLAEGRNGWQR